MMVQETPMAGVVRVLVGGSPRPADRVCARVRLDPASAREIRRQIEALAYIVNTRVAGWSFEHAVLVYAALAGQVRGLDGSVRQEALEIYRGAERIGAHYVGVNHAIRTVDLAGHITQETIGMAHRGVFDGHPPVGRYPFPQPALCAKRTRERPASDPGPPRIPSTLRA
jgi:hypothetical protein